MPCSGATPLKRPRRACLRRIYNSRSRCAAGSYQPWAARVTDALPEPKSQEAYELYLRSSVIPYDPEPNPQATVMLERAVALDPTYAPAWHSLSRRYYTEGHFGSGDPAMLDRALAAGERALALDPDDVNMAGALAANRIERGQLAESEALAENLLRRQANNAIAQFIMSYVLRYQVFWRNLRVTARRHF